MSTRQKMMESLLKGEQGHFARSLAESWEHADSKNRKKIEEAFPDLFLPVTRIRTYEELKTAPAGMYWVKFREGLTSLYAKNNDKDGLMQLYKVKLTSDLFSTQFVHLEGIENLQFFGPIQFPHEEFQ